jgi:arylsulfatase A-like enzyme
LAVAAENRAALTIGVRLLHFLALAVLCSSLGARAQTPSAKLRHVVVVVWDGMRPDSVDENHTPTLLKLAREGVTFRNHHASYLSATVVNGTAIATGCYPAGSGIFANYVFQPEISPFNFVDTGQPSVVRKGDAVSGGKYLAKPTVAEILHGAGKRTSIAGTKFITLMFDRRARGENDAAQKSDVLFQGATWPNELIASLSSMFGPFPGIDDESSDQWTTRALIDGLWKDGVPQYSLLWLRDPDHVQHKTAAGSPQSLAAVKRSDNCLAEILAALKKRKLWESTDILVVSDHGFSTIERSVDLLPLLNRAGFRALKEFTRSPRDGEIMVVGNGGTVLFYVIGHDATVTQRLVSWLQHADFSGVIFSREKIEGTFSLAQAKIDTPTAPDIAMAFRWNDQPNEFGVRGMIDADWNRKAGAGTHATLSKFDMHNMLIAAGPDFRHGAEDQLPTGNTDLTPTILHLLGVAASEKMDGRVLSEALADGRASEAETKMLTASRSFEHGSWQQYLKVSRVGSTLYLDEGNGHSTGNN